MGLINRKITPFFSCSVLLTVKCTTVHVPHSCTRTEENPDLHRSACIISRAEQRKRLFSKFKSKSLTKKYAKEGLGYRKKGSRGKKKIQWKFNLRLLFFILLKRFESVSLSFSRRYYLYSSLCVVCTDTDTGSLFYFISDYFFFQNKRWNKKGSGVLNFPGKTLIAGNDSGRFALSSLSREKETRTKKDQ